MNCNGHLFVHNRAFRLCIFLCVSSGDWKWNIGRNDGRPHILNRYTEFIWFKLLRRKQYINKLIKKNHKLNFSWIFSGHQWFDEMRERSDLIFIFTIIKDLSQELSQWTRSIIIKKLFTFSLVKYSTIGVEDASTNAFAVIFWEKNTLSN